MSDTLKDLDEPVDPTLDDLFNMQPELLTTPDLTRLVAAYRDMRVRYHQDIVKPKKDKQGTKVYENKIGKQKLQPLSELLG